MRTRALLWALVIFCGVLPRAAIAGMPMITLSDIARQRVQTISFFGVALLLCALVVGRIWNGLRDDFPNLPRLTFRKSLAIVVLWGLAFIIVLTMISGTRELMSPGAWQKQGSTYRLASPEASPAANPVDDNYENSVPLREERTTQLRLLHVALTQYARGHDERYPDKGSTSEIPDERWQLPGAFGMRYVYVPDDAHSAGDTPVIAYEPEVFGESRLLLLKSGRIVESAGDIENWLQQGNQP